MEGPPDRVRKVDSDGANAQVGQPDLRLHELVPEHRPQAAARRTGIERQVLGAIKAPTTTSSRD
jgi:hypothetical protein